MQNYFIINFLFPILLNELKREELRLRAIEHRIRNKELLKLKDKERNKTERRKAQHRKSFLKNKDIKNKRRRDRYRNDENFKNKLKEKSLKYHYENHDKNILKNQKYFRENRNILNKKRNEFHYKHTYGITIYEKREMEIRQNSKCIICGKKFKNTADIHVDHNHNTKEVRMLLCHKCNTGIGMFNEDTERMEQAIFYLKMFNKKEK